MNKLNDEGKSADLVLDNTNLEQVLSCLYLGVILYKYILIDK